MYLTSEVCNCRGDEVIYLFTEPYKGAGGV